MRNYIIDPAVIAPVGDPTGAMMHRKNEKPDL